jgi:Domain of unknown function (DUF4375)
MAFESDPIAAKLNDFVGSHQAYMWLMCFDELPPVERALIAIWELEQEVYNGGFLQYLQNWSGNRVPFICEILRGIDANNAACAVERAIALVGPGIPWDDEVERYTMLNTLSDENKSKLSQLGQEFYEQLDDLNLMLFRYLSEHHDQLDAPKDFWTVESLTNDPR